jgi:diadenosine tetraphosphatase ApaH/serine/threonine PP2A family protein phosphatase
MNSDCPICQKEHIPGVPPEPRLVPKTINQESAMPDLDLKYNREPVCPHCGHVHRDAWEWDFGPGGGSDIEIECYACGLVFFVSRNVEVTYTTAKVQPKG